MDIESVLESLILRFNEKAQEDEKLRTDLKDITRMIMVEFGDGESYNFTLQDCQLTKLSKGAVDSPDIKIITDRETFEGLIEKRIGPMKALLTGKLKLEASIEDKLRLRKLF